VSISRSGFIELGSSGTLTRLGALLSALLASVILFAANAATASALPEPTAQWGNTITGEPVEPRNVGFDGTVLALTVGEWGQFTCDADGKLALLPDGRGNIAFQFDPETCSGSGILKDCVLESGGSAGALPVVAGEESLTVGDFKVVVDFADQEGNGCSYEGGRFETEALDDWEAAVDPYGISEIPSLDGEATVRYPSGMESTVFYSSGDLQLAAKDSGLYTLIPPPFADFDPFWTQGGLVLEENAETTAEGYVELTSEFGGLSCEVSASVELQPGNVGSLEPQEVGPCKGTSGIFGEYIESCEVEEWESTPWSLEAGSNSIDVGNLETTIQLESGCTLEALEEFTFTGEEVTLTPYAPGSISALEISGPGQLVLHRLGDLEAQAEASGGFAMDEPGLYGIG